MPARAARPVRRDQVSTKRIAAILAVLALGLAGCSSEPIRTYSKAELEQAVREETAWDKQALLQDFPDAVVPEVTVVRYVSPEAWSGVMVDCLRAAGQDASVIEGGGLSLGESSSTPEALRLAYYVCEWQYPADPRRDIPLNEQQIKYLYLYEVQTLKPCLEAHGFAKSMPVPTMQHFVSTIYSDYWDPYAGLHPDALWGDVNKACPPEPPGLYGG